jgi:hypothetical protein
MEVVSIDASPRQLARLRNGHSVRVKRGEVHGCGLVVHGPRSTLMRKNFDKGKAVNVQLSPEELQANHQAVQSGEIGGGGIFAGGKTSGIKAIHNGLKALASVGHQIG